MHIVITFEQKPVVIICNFLFFDFFFQVAVVVVTTVVAAAILLANVPREGVTDKGVEEGVDEGEDEAEDEAGGDDEIEMMMNTGNRDTAFGNELFME